MVTEDDDVVVAAKDDDDVVRGDGVVAKVLKKMIW